MPPAKFGMKIVIQCAQTKLQDAGTFSHVSGQRIWFVANPKQCPAPTSQLISCRPDDEIGFMPGTWRDLLVRYNRDNSNPNALFRAADLYRPKIYQSLVARYGWQNVFILSAGWGLVRADYLIPPYDITFSAQASPCNRRSQRDFFKDFQHFQKYGVSSDETIYFFGGKDYLALFHSLTKDIAAAKIVHYAGRIPEKHEGYHYVRYKSFTNWHYACVRDFMTGKVHS